jgi:hypothetical protein
MNNTELASAALAKLESTIELAAHTKYDWKKACEEGTTYLHNTISALQREPFTKELTLYDLLNKAYQSELKNGDVLNGNDLSEWPEFESIYNKFRAAIDALPSSLPKTRKEFEKLWSLHKINLEDLTISIHSFYEETNGECSFDLGDDGSDECEQSLESIRYLLSIFTAERDFEYRQRCYESDLIWFMARANTNYHYIDEQTHGAWNPLTSNPSELYCIFSHVSKSQYYNDEVNLYLKDLIKWNNMAEEQFIF